MQQETVPQILLRTALRFHQIKDLSSPQIKELMPLSEVEFQKRLGEIRSQDSSPRASGSQISKSDPQKNGQNLAVSNDNLFHQF
ncbi:hypothetical protein NIES4101_67060 [Calothrix sp. NIES-4101]|nr:hypothetical protein NIES4101_67060 [Calothrix sp. NIES-4101]